MHYLWKYILEPPRLEVVNLEPADDNSFTERRERKQSNHDYKKEISKESKSFTRGLKKSFARTFHKSKTPKHIDISQIDISSPISSRDASPSGMVVENIDL